MFVKAALKYWYNWISKNDDGQLRFLNFSDNLYQYCLDEIGDIKNKIVLDIGCGRGYGTAFLQKKSPAQIVGFDFAKKGIKDACKLYQGIRFEKRDAEKLHKTPGSYYDFVFSVEMLHCLKSKSAFFKGINWILVKYGVLVIADIITPDNFPRVKKIAEQYGLQLEYTKEITAKILRDLKASSEWRREVVNQQRPSIQNAYAGWAGIPGSVVFKELQSRKLIYVLWVFTKKEGV